MKRNIDSAVKLYSGDKPLGLFADRLEGNLNSINAVYQDIYDLYESERIANFERLPDTREGKAKFALLFKILNAYLEAAKVQGFVWSKSEYHFKHDDGEAVTVVLALDERTYLTLLQRYKELSRSTTPGDDAPFEIEGYITEINTGVIDAEYMNSRFEKYLKALQSDAPAEVIEQTLNELHKTFASLSQEEQKFANIFLRDVERGDAKIEEGKTLQDYIAEYQVNAKNDQIHRFAVALGVDEGKLRTIMALHVTESNINEYGRFNALVETVDKAVAKHYFETTEGQPVPSFKLSMKINAILRKFILSDGFEV